MTAGIPSEDYVLVSSARNGEREAREALGRRVGRSAYVFALQMTSNGDVARDIAQDSVLRFFKTLSRFDTERPIDPWLYQIVRNRVRDLARRNRIRRAESLDAWLEDRQWEVADVTADPAAHAERLDMQRRIWRAVSELSESHREIFILRDHHDLSYSEIAEVLSIPRGTVMSRLHAARQRLRASLAEDRPDGRGE